MLVPKGYKPMDVANLTDTTRLTIQEFIDWYNSDFGTKGGVYHVGINLCKNDRTRSFLEKLSFISKRADKPILHIKRIDHGEYKYIIRRSTFNPHARRIDDFFTQLSN